MTLSIATRAACLCSVAVLAAACSDSAAPKPPAPHTPSIAPKAAEAAGAAKAAPGDSATNPAAGKLSTSTSDPSIIEIGGLEMPKPATWTWQAPSMAFRTLQYAVPAEGSGSGGELVFSFFAAGDGGALDANIERWHQQFRGADGNAAPFERADREVNGLKVIVMKFAGSYQGMGAAAPRQGMEQLGAIVQAPSGNVFIRLIGPSATVNSHRDAFASMIKGLKLAK